MAQGRATFHLGVGLSERADADGLIAGVEQMLEAAGITAAGLKLATIETRKGHPALEALADHFGTSPAYFSPQALDAQTSRLLNPSEELFLRIGCHGVAEAAALASAGRHGVLVVGKTKCGGATIALAKSE
ncbi:cobalamin biosynthesis protein [Rhizobium sp. KVB221]|uniref:Cobalamin biosynthesis protein n=1 Tax=Rhizobium setariae TaxID=2801340 RepID=A0A936YMG8_9HYPH|nr:cobalamin biosynthesis protein [Rhizobium setariae]MBL0373150.1 cobalamin biosynthesis protein [Rhizobium setariae]